MGTVREVVPREPGSEVNAQQNRMPQTPASHIHPRGSRRPSTGALTSTALLPTDLVVWAVLNCVSLPNNCAKQPH